MGQESEQQRYHACDTADMKDGEVIRIEPPGLRPVAVYRLEGEFYATDDTCTHGSASLADGEVDEDGVVECPFHAGTFDIRTGEALSFPCVLPLKTYLVVVEDGMVYVDLKHGQLPEG
jgi:nitrite reductase/ring-hydroxylating ferredoxin subunit